MLSDPPSLSLGLQLGGLSSLAECSTGSQTNGGSLLHSLHGRSHCGEVGHSGKKLRCLVELLRWEHTHGLQVSGHHRLHCLGLQLGGLNKLAECSTGVAAAFSMGFIAGAIVEKLEGH